MRRFFLSVLVLCSVAVSGLGLLPQRAEAAAFGLVPCALQNNDPSTSWNDTDPCTLCHFLIGMQRIVHFLRNVMTAIAIAVIVAMAIVYITSAGDESRMSFAKEGIKYSLVGFAVILLAWVAVNFIFTLPLFSSSGLVRTDGSWDNFTCNTKSRSASGTSAQVASSIGNASGSSVYGGVGRAENPGPGAQPPVGGGTPPASCGNGTCESGLGELCSNCPGDCGTCGGANPGGSSCNVAMPLCGATHYACTAGKYDGNGSTDASGSAWDCIGGTDHTCPFTTCIEYAADNVCGNNKVEGGEQCDDGAARGSCPYTCSWHCEVNDCSGVVVVPPGCGPSNGSDGAPSGELCVGGATASSVIESNVGTSKRYDWTCTKDSSVFQCSSGTTTDFGGNPTAVCGSAAGVPSATAPSANLCSVGYLDNFGVKELTHAVTGEPLWNWGCVPSKAGGTQTSCFAPRTN